MSNGLNLHDIVRTAIVAVHPDETVTLYQSTGQVNNYGEITPTYAAGQVVQAQIQSEGDAALYHADRVGMNSQTIKAYLYADKAFPPAGVDRPFCRNGDIFQRDDGTWWLITAVTENFAGVGWVSVRGTLQVNPPDFSASSWYGVEDEPESDDLESDDSDSEGVDDEP